MTWVSSWLLTWDGQRGPEVHEVRIRASPWRAWECARTQTSLISSSLASSLFSFLLSLPSPPPPPLLTKALCTQPLPLAAVSEPRPYENHMGERG